MIRRIYMKNHPGLPRPQIVKDNVRRIYTPRTEGTIYVYREREPYERKKPES